MSSKFHLNMNNQSVQFNIEFISEVEKHPQLYNNKLPDYSDRRVTEAIWAQIAEKFNETGADCKSKWKSIRTAYIHSLKMISRNKSKKEYYLATHLQFLNPFTKNRPQSSFVEVPNEWGIEDSENEELLQNIKQAPDSSEPPSPSSTRSSFAQLPRSKKMETNSDIDYFVGKRKKMDSVPIESNRDPCKMFLLSLVPHMASMTQRQQLSFQKGALDLIEKITYGQPHS